MVRVRLADATQVDGLLMPPATRRSSPRADRCPTGRTSPTTEPGCSRRSGVASVDDLFDDIPAALRASAAADRRRGAELELSARLAGLAARNRVDLASFLGAGAYRHWTPPAVDQLLLRGEWYTAYTPVPARGQPGDAPEHLRVPVAARRADRPRRGLGQPLRRRRGHRRGRADDVPRDAPRPAARLARRPSPLPPDAGDVRRGRGPRGRRGPAGRRRAGRRHDGPRGARAAARRRGPAGRGRRRGPAHRSSACSRTCPRSGASRTPPARCS